MLGFYLNNKPFLLRQDTSVVISYRNPACFFDSLQNFAGLGIEIPVNDTNRSMLGLPHRFDRDMNRNSRKFTGFDIRYSGVILIAGTLIIQSANGETYSGWCQSDLGALGEAQQEKYINEMAWPEAQVFAHQATYDDDTDDYGITLVHNRNFWEGKGAEKEGYITYLDTGGIEMRKDETRSVLTFQFQDNYSYLVNNYNPADIKDGCVVSPFLHLRYVIRESLRLNGFNIRRNDMLAGTYSLSYLKNQMVYNNFNILELNLTTDPVTLPTWDYGVDKMVPIDYEQIAIDGGKTWLLNTFNYADLLPRKSYKDFLLGLQNFHNYIFVFSTDGNVDIIDRNEILNTTAIDVNDYFRGEWEMGEQKQLRLKLISEYDKDDAKFGEEFDDLSDRWNDFGDPVLEVADLDLIAYPQFGELRLVKKTNEIYEYGWQVGTSENEARQELQVDVVGWKFVSSGTQPYVYGTAEEEEEIKTAISPTQHFSSLFGAITLLCPVVVQKGNISKMRSLWNDYTLRLLPGNSVLHGRSLYWEGDEGLFKNRWEKWARFWKDRLPASASFQLPLNMVIYIQNNITNKFRTQQGEFIIEEMETEFGMHQIGETRIKGYKV